MYFLGEYSELIRFWATLVQFWPSSGKKTRLEMGQNGGFLPLSEKQFTESNLNLVCTLFGWVFRNYSLLGHVGQILALKWPKNWLKMLVSDHYLKKYSHNPIQTRCVHLLGVCTELIHFGATLAKFWPSSGHKITEMVVSDHYMHPGICNSIQAIQFKHGVYPYILVFCLWTDNRVNGGHLEKISFCNLGANSSSYISKFNIYQLIKWRLEVMFSSCQRKIMFDGVLFL